MTDLFLDQYCRLLDSLPASDPWPALENSGFLDFLISEASGGGGASLEDLFPLALETGRRLPPADVLSAMASRLSDPVPRPLAAILAAGEMAGALSAIEALTVDYVRTRKQFGREIGRFQAIQQQIAVLTEEVIAAHMAAGMAFVGEPAKISENRAAAAKLRCNRAAFRAASIAHAVHGAIGVSEDYGLHRFTGRLRQLAMAHGGETTWAQKLGDWVLNEGWDITSLVRAL